MNEQQLYESLKAANVPEHLRGGIVRYVQSGIIPGSFLRSVIANDLISAVCRADDTLAIGELRAVCRWFLHQAPMQCHGTYFAMDEWSSAKAKEYGIQNREEITR